VVWLSITVEDIIPNKSNKAYSFVLLLFHCKGCPSQWSIWTAFSSTEWCSGLHWFPYQLSISGHTRAICGLQPTESSPGWILHDSISSTRNTQWSRTTLIWPIYSM